MRWTFGGRDFESAGVSTIEQDLAYWRAAQAAGLDSIERLKDESWDDYAVRLLNRIIATGQALPLLGCLLMPADRSGEVWTPEIGREVQEHLRGLTAEEDKARFRSVLLSTLIDFFESGMGSSRSSRTSLSETHPGPVPPDTTAGASGRPSSANSPGATSKPQRGWFAGLFGKFSAATAST
jgi:hypothetical protein